MVLSSQDVSRKKRILVITGTTGFDSLVRNIDEDRSLEQDFDIVLQTGDGSYIPKYKPSFKFDKMIMNTLQDYDFFITHAGAGTVYHLLENQKRLLVVPNTDRADKHQVELAQHVNFQQLCSVCFHVQEISSFIKNIEYKTQHLKSYNKMEFNAAQNILNYIYE